MADQAKQDVQRTDEDREFAAITDQEIFEEARDRLAIAIEATSDNRKRAKEAMLFRAGAQWDHDVTTTTSQDEPELVINLTDSFVRKVVNNIKQQRPRGKCHPVGEGADIEMADIINGIGRHIETRSEASVAYDMAAERAVDAGEGYFRIMPEFVDERSFNKDLRILPIPNIFSVHLDPSSIMPSGADANWGIISVKMKRQEYKRKFPNAKNSNWNDIGNANRHSDWEDKEEIRLAEYFRVREVQETLYLIRGNKGQELGRFKSELPKNDGKFDIEWLKLQLAPQGLWIADERQSARRKLEWFRLNGLAVVEREELPGQYIPIFRVAGNAMDIEGTVHRSGMVESMMDPQRMVNYGEVAKIKRLGLAPKAPWVAAEGQLDGHPEWEDANQKTYSVLTYKPVVIETSGGPISMPPPQRQPPAQIEAGFADFVQGMRSNLLAVAGMPSEPGQDPQGVVVSGQAIKRRQYMSDQSHFQYYDNLTLAIAQCWRVMVEWIPAYFSEQRIQRIIGDDSTPTMTEINKPVIEDGIKRIKNDLSVGKYDVVMDTGAGFETKREEGAENLLQMLKIPQLAEMIAKSGPDLVFRSIDHPYMQELADRLMAQNPEGLQKVMEGLSEKAKNIVQTLASENQQLQQQIQALNMELKTGLQKEQIAVGAKVHDTMMRSHTALAVEEIRATGKLIDTKAEHGHEADMFEKQVVYDAIQAGMQDRQQQPQNGGNNGNSGT